MKTAILPFRFPRLVAGVFPATACLMLFSTSLSAQQAGASQVEEQVAAMRKLSFLTGYWSGPVDISRGPAKPLHLTQTEDVEYKLDGLVLLIQGKSTDASGKVLFRALATVAYDDASHTYRFRAYHDGNYLDTELSVTLDGFRWGFSVGPAHIVNTMHLSSQGEWKEETEVTVGKNPPRRSLEMVLRQQR